MVRNTIPHQLTLPVLGQEVKAFLLIRGSSRLTASRLIADFLTVFATNHEMPLAESMALHSRRPSSHAERTITEAAVAFAFTGCQIQFKSRGCN